MTTAITTKPKSNKYKKENSKRQNEKIKIIVVEQVHIKVVKE